MAIVLIGFMGAGKSTAATELAQALGVAAFDSDAVLGERLGHPAAREFELHGEASFRAKEQEVVCELLDRAPSSSVIALGGGSVLSERVREALAVHTTVLLDVEPQTAWERLQGEEQLLERPLARERGAFLELHAERRELYEGLADAILSGVEPGGYGRAAGALAALAGAPSGTRLLWARSASG